MELRKVIKDILRENETITPRRLLKRDVDIPAMLDKKTGKAITFTGFRRVGKTHLMFLVREQLKDRFCIYFNFEDERLPESTEVLTQFLYAVEELYQKKPDYLFLDEIHVMPGWGKYLRRIIDQGYRLFVTGSSSKLGLKEIPTELRGRTLNYSIMPLSFGEYLFFKDIAVPGGYVDSRKEAEINRFFDEYLVYGGFPELVDAGELERKEVIQEYYRTLVQRDLIDRFNLKEDELLNATAKLLLNSMTLSISKLTNTLKSMGFRCSKNTISNYISYMEKTFFLHQAFYYSTNVKDQLQYPRKIYFVDSGFLKFMSLNPDKSRSLENLAALELKRRGYDLYYWRNARGEEVDFVLTGDGEDVQLVQVCYELSLPSTREREIRGMLKGMEHFGTKKGIVLTANQSEVIREGGIEIPVIPMPKWLLEGGREFPA